MQCNKFCMMEFSFVRVCFIIFSLITLFSVLHREWLCIKRRLKIDSLVQVQGSPFWLGRGKQPAQEDLTQAMFNQPRQGRQVLPLEYKTPCVQNILLLYITPFQEIQPAYFFVSILCYYLVVSHLRTFLLYL